MALGTVANVDGEVVRLSDTPVSTFCCFGLVSLSAETWFPLTSADPTESSFEEVDRTDTADAAGEATGMIVEVTAGVEGATAAAFPFGVDADDPLLTEH